MNNRVDSIIMEQMTSHKLMNSTRWIIISNKNSNQLSLLSLYRNNPYKIIKKNKKTILKMKKKRMRIMNRYNKNDDQSF